VFDSCREGSTKVRMDYLLLFLVGVHSTEIKSQDIESPVLLAGFLQALSDYILLLL
jgi:hypothetical protein